jgi:hypothetical protein
MPNRDDLLFDLQLALRKISPGTTRDLATCRRPGDELAERIAAERILEHLELCGWRMEHKPTPPVSAAR